MKLEKEAKLIRVINECSINDKNKYVEIRLDKPLSNKDFKKIVNNFAGKKVKLTLETKESILDDIEKEYLSGVIRPFRDGIDCIEKMSDIDGDYIKIYLKNYEHFTLPYFKKNTMYKNMELDKEYTLEDLEL